MTSTCTDDVDVVRVKPSDTLSLGCGSNKLLQALKIDGYVIIENFLPDDIVEVLDRQSKNLEERHAQLDYQEKYKRHPPGWTEIPGLIEISALVRHLTKHPFALYLASNVLGPDFELASAGELDIKYPGEAQAYCGWHTDFIWIPKLPYPRQVFWLACYYFLSDIDPSSGPLIVLPRSHDFDHPPDASSNDQTGRGRLLPGARALSGCAGTAVFFNNEIWHMSPMNRSGRARRMIKIHYKPSWMKPWGGGRAISPAFCTRQTDPVLRQLVGSTEYDDVEWQYGTDANASRYPAWRERCETEDITDWGCRSRGVDPSVLSSPHSKRTGS